MKVFLTYLVVISLIVPSAPIAAAMTMQSNTVASTTRQLPAAAAPDGGWPRSYMTPSGGGVVVYEPQVASWVDQKQIVMYAAVAYTTSDARSALGTIMVEADTKIAVPERLVSFSALEIGMANFPTLSREQLDKVVSEIKSATERLNATWQEVAQRMYQQAGSEAGAGAGAEQGAPQGGPQPGGEPSGDGGPGGAVDAEYEVIDEKDKK